LAIVVISRGPLAGRRVPITNWPATIGRDNTNSIILDDERVSRFHARIKRRDRQFIIEDLNSRNGTYINGDRVSNSTLQSGDKIIIGDSELMFLTPESNIDIATDMIDFEHVVQPELGIDQPIEIVRAGVKGRVAGLERLGVVKDLSSANLSTAKVKQVFEQHANFLEATTLEEAASQILKTLHGFLPMVQRSAVFLWSSNSRRLIPLASRFSGKKRPFSFTKRGFEDVVSRKGGVIIASQASGVTQSLQRRLILPVMSNQDIIAVIHAEIDAMAAPIDRDALDLFLIYLLRCASAFESFLLRRDLDSYMVGMIETMIATIEAKDTYTHGHSERVSRYSMVIAEEMKLSKEVKKLLLMSSLCHDIGKIGIPDAILRKASMLSVDEYEEMKLHPVIGANIVSHMPNAKKILSGVKYHHEKWDGSGYPDGLVGEDIPFFGRIVAVADVFDAMISGRSYAGFMESDNAIEKLNDENDLFDPDVLAAFTRAHEHGALTQRTSTKENKKSSKK
jgi:HD-GYP domain-containing protein (c-di-GMP phosphodiesterase class II)